MKSFFDGVRRHIGNMDAEHLREQYRRLSDEVSSLDTLFSTISQGIIVLDERGEVAKSNPAARELLGMDPEDALPMLAIAHGKSSKREIDITYPEARNLEIQTMPMGDGTLVCLRDVTAERERTEEELRIGATRAVRDLAAGVAHEIGNPLNALSLNLQLLKRSGGEKPEVDECIRQVERLSGIIHGFLRDTKPIAEFVEVESGRKKDRPQLTAALELCRKSNAKLIVAKLDRLARNVCFLSQLLESDVEITFCDFPSANKMMLHIVSAIAQYEAELTAARTKQALAAKKARGCTLGNPEHLMDKHAEALSHSNETNRAKANSNPNNKRAVAMLRVLVEKGLTLQQMADTLNDEGFTTSRGCKFRPSTVYALIKRYQLNRKATKP